MTNLLLHLLCVGLVCLLLRQWPLTRGFWLPAALLFAVRPTDVETVAWIKNRSDLFAAVFFFGAILVLPLPLGRRRGWLRTVVGALLFALAIMSKEVAIVLPALLMVAFTCPRNWRKGWAMTLPFWAVAVAYMVVRAAALVTPPSAAGGASGLDMVSRFQGAATTLVCYARLLVLPVHLTLDHLPPSKMLLAGGGPAVAALGLVACLLVAAALNQWRTAMVGALWFALALLPISNVIPLRDRPFAEQRLYVAALGFCVLLAAALRCRQRRSTRAVLLGLVVVGSTAMAVSRAGLWASNIELWREAVKVTAKRDRALTNFGNAYAVVERDGRAEFEYRRALRVHPESREAMFRLGQVLDRRGAFGLAEQAYDKVTAWAPRGNEARYAKAHLLMRQARHDEALGVYREMLEARPQSPEAWHGIALIHDQQGRTVAAISACTRAIAFDPNYLPARRVRGVLLTTRDATQAVQDLSVAIAIDPEFAPAYLDRASALMELGRFDKAQADIDAALDRDPSAARAAPLLDRLNALRKQRRQ